MLKTKCIKALKSKSFENQNSMFVDESSLPLSDVATRKLFTSSILYSLWWKDWNTHDTKFNRNIAQYSKDIATTNDKYVESIIEWKTIEVEYLGY